MATTFIVEFARLNEEGAYDIEVVTDIPSLREAMSVINISLNHRGHGYNLGEWTSGSYIAVSFVDDDTKAKSLLTFEFSDHEGDGTYQYWWSVKKVLNREIPTRPRW